MNSWRGWALRLGCLLGVAWVVVACEGAASEPAVTKGEATTSSSEYDPSPVFVRSSEEIAETLDDAVSLASMVKQAFNAADTEVLESLMESEASFLDPFESDNPQTTFEVLDLFGGPNPFADLYGPSDTYANLGGVVSREVVALPGATESGFVDAIRQLATKNALVTSGKHWLSWSDMTSNAEGIVAALGQSTGTADRALAGADATADFRRRLEVAWHSETPWEVSALYADDARRIDGFTGDLDGWLEIEAWYADLFASYPDLRLVSSGHMYTAEGGAVVLYSLEMSIAAELCEMRVASVFTLNDVGEISTETVYYNPDSAFACGWDE